jgi:hypothetical protein
VHTERAAAAPCDSEPVHGVPLPLPPPPLVRLLLPLPSFLPSRPPSMPPSETGLLLRFICGSTRIGRELLPWRAVSDGFSFILSPHRPHPW